MKFANALFHPPTHQGSRADPASGEDKNKNKGYYKKPQTLRSDGFLIPCDEHLCSSREVSTDTMRIITDFHLHSKWSRACSKDLTLPNIARACERKGIGLVGTADAFHPAWQGDIDNLLEPSGDGVFRLKNSSSPTSFLLSTEISCIYTHDNRVRRVHHLILFPTREALRRLTSALTARGCNLKSDGRPIVGLHSKALLELTLEADPACLLIPAHAWTPWFSVFGSKSGYDSLEACFEDLTPQIFAIETGLSSDPAMNWRLSSLDPIFLVSNSDAHSCANLGREANVFDMERASYTELRRILVEHDTDAFIETIEFFPEEGKYHVDGHRACKFFCEPEETKRLNGICPICGHPLTIGVLHRVAELADRPSHPPRPSRAVPFRSIVPLAELVGDALGVGKSTQQVKKFVDGLLQEGRTEFGVLLELAVEEIQRIANPEIAEAIFNMRAGQVDIRPGYDGEYGVVKARGVQKKTQSMLL